jgi:hypothetical protein
MGIFFFLNFFLKAYNSKRRSSFGSASHRYLFFKNESTLCMSRLNLFKKNAGFKTLFKKKNFLGVVACIGVTELASAKVNFFFLNLILSFLCANSFFNFLNFFLSKKLKVSYLLMLVIKVLIVAVANGPFVSNLFFLNFYKFSDFFFYKKMVFTPAASYSFFFKSFFVRSSSFFLKRADELHLASKIKKSNFKKKVEGTPVAVDSAVPSYLFLMSSFFSKDKKFFFLRNNEIYNKSRYSRNRQTYRTGVFWCIWLTVLTVIGLYFYFYVFLIKFTYI